jgi:DNA-binding NarL/FixJ family response regulator
MAHNFLKHKETKVKVLIADDHPLMRYAIKGFINSQPDIEVVAEASDGVEAVRLSFELYPDVLIIDLGMPNLSGLEAIKLIKEKCPRIAILVLTVHSDSEHILSALAAGAAGYLMKDVFGDEVVKAIRLVIAGKTILSPAISKQLVQYTLKYNKKHDISEKISKLTSKEQEILKFAAMGFTNKKIAEEIGLSPLTVKSYFSEIFLKLGVRSRTEAVIEALNSGIIKVENKFKK